MTKDLKRVLLLTVAVKAAVLVLMGLGYFLFAFQSQNYLANFHYPPDAPVGFLTHFKTWDAQHYLFLADQGYAPQRMSNAFYPLFPLLIRILKFLFLGNSFLAALVLSNLFAVVATAYLWLLVRKSHDSKIATLACLLFLAFPTNFFSGIIYSESLFMALSTAFFYYWREKKTGFAGLCAFMLPLTRPTGVLLFLPVLADWFWRKAPKERLFQTEKLLVPGCLALGFFFYLIVMGFSTGDFSSGFQAQKYFAADYSYAHLLHPFNWFRDNFVAIDFSWDGVRTGVLNRVAFVAFLGIMLVGRKHLDRTFVLYALALGLVPVLSGNLMSYTRLVSVIFPLFIILAVLLKRRAEFYLFPSLALQALFVLLHSLNYWLA
jgi:hypothetical protein